MINYNRLVYEIKRDLSNFSEKISKGLKRPQKKVDEEHAVIVIDNSDITKPCSPKMEAISDVHDGSTGEIRKGYLTVEAAVLSKGKKMPMPVYEKVFSSAEDGFISMTHENLCCLKSLSAHFGKNCIRTLDRGFDANEYYRYFLKNDEKFVIRAKKNRNVIYRNKTQNIMDVAGLYKGSYRLDFMDKRKKKTECGIS